MEEAQECEFGGSNIHMVFSRRSRCMEEAQGRKFAG